MINRNVFSGLWILAAVMAAGSAGCGSDAGTAVAITGGSMGAGLLLAEAVTGSNLDVTVEVFAELDTDADTFRMARCPAIVECVRKMGDPTVNPTPENMMLAHDRLAGKTDEMRKLLGSLSASIATLKKLQTPWPDQAAELAIVIADFEAISARIQTALAAWEEFDGKYRSALADGIIQESELRELAKSLLALRLALSAQPEFKPSKEYIALLGTRLSIMLSENELPKTPARPAPKPPSGPATDKASEAASKPAAKAPSGPAKGKGSETATKPATETATKPGADDFTSRATTLMNAGNQDDRTETPALRVARVLDLARKTIQAFASEDLAKNGPAGLSAELRGFGIDLPVQSLLGANGVTDIADMLQAGALVPLALSVASGVACSFTYSAITSGVNLGPIQDEASQVILTGKALNVITDRTRGHKGDPRGSWRTLAHANSHAGPGNHDVVVYFENMATPVLKSSVFNPTNFIVANGELFRTAFAAVAGVYGLPSAPASGDKSELVDFNLMSIGARQQNATKSSAGAKSAAKAALGIILDQDDKVTKAAKTWDNDKDGVVAGVQEALKNAAGKLQTAGQ